MTSSEISGHCGEVDARTSWPRLHLVEHVKRPSDATRANENIPTRRHRAKTTLEELSIWSSFLTSSLGSTRQVEDQS
jgi:hypothetical protein